MKSGHTIPKVHLRYLQLRDPINRKPYLEQGLEGGKGQLLELGSMRRKQTRTGFVQY